MRVSGTEIVTRMSERNWKLIPETMKHNEKNDQLSVKTMMKGGGGRER